MKKLLLISVLAPLIFSSCICAKYVEAEDQNDLRWNAGDWTVGGKLAFNSSAQGDLKDSEFKISPTVGTFLNENLEVGLGARFSSNKNESGSFEDKWSSIAAGPYLRYYWCDEHRLLPFVDVGVNYLSNNYDTADYKQTGFDARAGLGVNYFVNEWLALNVGYTALSYQNLSDDRDGVDNISNFSGKLNTNRLNLGVKLRF